MNEIKSNLMWFYNQYATDNGLTLSQAEQKVSKFDLQQWKQQVEALKQEDIQPPAMDRIKAIVTTAGINKHYMLYAMIGLSIIKLSNRQNIAFNERLKRDITDEGKHLAMSLKHSKRLTRSADNIINATVNGTKWSERLWNTGDDLTNAVKQTVDSSLRKGTTLDDIQTKLFPHLNDKKLDMSIASDFKKAESVSKRLIRTESARVKFEIDKQYYKSQGVKLFDWITEPGACQICVGLEEGSPYTVEDLPNIPGSSHANCRCSIIPRSEKGITLANAVVGAATVSVVTDTNPSEHTQEVVKQDNDNESTIPNSDQAIITAEKTRDYVLNKEHKVGGSKARVFASALGYNKGDYKQLISEIKKNMNKYPAIPKGNDGYGPKYQIDMMITGPNGKTKPVRTGWIIKTGTREPFLTSAYVITKRDGKYGNL